ncbi:aminopeptidase [Flammeovirgaceae bacterium SG7u.111]|nr:aminopeptidase [Flammeovirgaceae bacterium SG7u.132]WPO35451.1 aminopeptidase [Flammeovirgaceae bacterium SG7u.111]
MDYSLLKQLCQVFAPAGDERLMKQFVLDYVENNKKNWKVQPEVITNDDLQDCIVLVFGKPKTAIFAHMDSIGFTVKYDNELVKIGGPRIKHNWTLVGKDKQGDIECLMSVPEGGDKASYKFEREIDRGTNLVFKSDFRTSDESIQSCYMDNRLGCFNALKVAETLENGIICFSCYEEVGGGTAMYLGKYIYENYGVKQALISDITWVTDGVRPGKGVVISMRDSGLPRRSYLEKIIGLAEESGIPFQLEVEDAGGSDGNQLLKSPYPFDWCFIGAPEDNVHTPDEIVKKKDIEAMVDLYNYLMPRL